MENGGEGGIRTPDTLARMPHFECGAIDHSATSPQKRLNRWSKPLNSRGRGICQQSFCVGGYGDAGDGTVYAGPVLPVRPVGSRFPPEGTWKLERFSRPDKDITHPRWRIITSSMQGTIQQDRKQYGHIMINFACIFDLRVVPGHVKVSVKQICLKAFYFAV